MTIHVLERLIEKIVQGLRWEILLVCLDEVVIFTNSFLNILRGWMLYSQSSLNVGLS